MLLPATAIAALGAPAGSRHAPIGARSATVPATVNCSVEVSRMTPSAEAQALQDGINAYRLANGAQALQPSSALTRYAHWKATDMAVNSDATHDDGFRTVEQRFID